MDNANHSRLSLTALLGLLLACAAGGNGLHRSVHPRQPDWSGTANLLSRPIDPVEAAVQEQLAVLLDRRPTSAEWKRVAACLEYRSWSVAAAALRVLRVHHHPELSSAQLQLLARSLDQELEDKRAAYGLRMARVALMHEVLDAMVPPADPAHTDLLVRVLARGPDGQARARAMELLAMRPPADWEGLVPAALADPSQRVRLAALDIIAERRWSSAWPAIELLAASPRPALRNRASELLKQLEKPVRTRSYSESVLQAAQALSDELWRSGLRPRDVLPLAESELNDREIESLARRAEEYLDQSFDTSATAADCPGVLLLALAVRAGQEKLTRRLWEHEVKHSDSDDELLDRGLESLARSRLLAGLAAYHRGDQAGGLEEFASVARLGRHAAPHSRLHVYLRRASELSQAIWQGTVSGRGDQSGQHAGDRQDPLARLTSGLFSGLDWTNPDHRTQAHERLDEWCGVAPPPDSMARPRNPMAN